MDVTLLTLLLLKLLPNVTINEEKKIKGLRKKRNDLAHNPKAQLTDDVPFNEAEKIIKDLSQSVGPEFEKKIGEQIELLRRTELVRVHTKLEMIHLRGEQFAGELIEGDVNGQYKDITEFWIKFGLTKWVPYMSRSLKIDILLQELKTEGIISDTVKRSIEHCYNFEEQMQSLALHMMDETKENLLRFCSSIRKLNAHIADLLEDKMTDGSEIEDMIKTHEHSRIKEILTASVFGNKGDSISCEEIHIFVESRQKRSTYFSVIAQCVKEVFGNDTYQEGDDKFVGIGWKNKEMTTEFVQEVTEESLTDMSCDIFAKILGEKMEKIRGGIGKHFEEKVLEESLSSNIFANLTPELLEEIFSPGLSVKYGIGIKNCLSALQKDIKRQINRAPLENSDTLRKIDQTADTVSYTKSTVTPSQGNLLVAAHEFVYPVRKGEFSTAFMAKDVIRFAAACINGKKNGTIHFGIEDIGRKSGRIVGLDKKIFGNRAALDEEITQSMKMCFQKDYDVASRCVRPVQVVSVEDDYIVLEVDIVPSACYSKETLITVNYPPKGNCRECCYIYIKNIIVAVEFQKMEYVTEDSRAFFKDRTQLESQIFSPVENSVEKNQEKLRKLLTGGNKYVTDAFIPVICCGDASGSTLEGTIRQELADMSIAFTSSFAVFDFDYTVKLRRLIDNDSKCFLSKTANDFSTKRMGNESDLSVSGEYKMWIYTNGNEETGDERLNLIDWYKVRHPGVKNALDQIREQIPTDRGLLIFLVFQKKIGLDPMLEIAKDCFLSTFKGESVIIAQDNESLRDWRLELSKRIDQDLLEKYIVSGLSWGSVSSTIRSLFKPSKEIEYSLPDSAGNIVVLTKRDMEELNFKHIEVIDGEAEKHLEVQEENMDDKECEERRLDEETEFYRGNLVTWWNFYYDNQVLKREAYELHRIAINKKLSSPDGEDLFETHLIEHHPGAGGSTLGRHMLWHFSQIKQSHKLAYRCCIINHITDNTVEEIYKFQSFKGGKARPVIALVDNPNEENILLLKHGLHRVAYNEGCPAKLFCLLLIVKRVPVSSSSRGIVLKHFLTQREEGMFKAKFKDLENRDADVKSLLAFNVMRNSFAKRFIDDTSKSLLDHVTQSEMELLKCLSVINAYDTDSPVPESIFDSLMRDEGFDSHSRTLTLKKCAGRPFGLVYSKMYMKKTDYVARETWNVNMSDEMQLMIKRTTISEKYHYPGVSILSQPLAESILRNIKDRFRLTLEDIVCYLLTVVKEHRDEVNPMSQQFVRVVCGLFTVRQLQESDKGEKEKFSDLILELEKPLPQEDAEIACKRAVGILEKCFIVTRSAFVGQQLARYNIHIKQFENAKTVIEDSLKITPHNSYLLDTYGQIFRAEMESLLGSDSQLKIADEEAAKIVCLAVNAIERFKMAQKANEFEEDFNTSCFLMEVKTLLLLLENFHNFLCYDDLECFFYFLNDRTFDIPTSSFRKLVELEPRLKQFQNGNEFQQHVEMSLRKIEEREYMLKNQLSAVVMPSKDVLMLKPRQAFERFYGSKEHTLQFEFHYGVGLKLLMKAFEANENLLQRRMEDAEKRLHAGINREMERDLLVYLGYYVIVISKRKFECDLPLYRKLVSYSTKLWKLQLEKRAEYRRYVEAYLYYAMFHWLIPSREETRIDILSHPKTMKECLKQWKQVFCDNLNIRPEQLYKNTPKIYFALGQGSPGDDIIDVEWIREQWRRAIKEEESRNRKEVKADKHWQHPVVEKEVLRLSGTVDSSGKKVNYKVNYSGKQYNLQIRTNETCIQLGNRPVTFILGFSWMAPTALDVRLDVQRQLSSRPSSGNSRNPGSDLTDLVVNAADTPQQETVQKKLSTAPSAGNSRIPGSDLLDLAPETPKQDSVSEQTDEDKVMESENIAGTMVERQAKTVNESGFVIVQDAKHSAEISKHLVENPPSYLVVVDICRNVAGGRKNLCLLMLHLPKVDGNETYVYQLSGGEPTLIAKGDLHRVFKTCKTVWFDIQSASVCLIEDYDVIIDNIADIKVMLRHVSSDDEELKTLELEQLESWSSRCIHYGKMLSSGQLNEEFLLELARHAELIGRVYAICERYIDQNVTCTKLRRAIGKETFEAAQPDRVKEKIQRLKKQEKKQRKKKTKKEQQKENEAQQ